MKLTKEQERAAARKSFANTEAGNFYRAAGAHGKPAKYVRMNLPETAMFCLHGCAEGTCCDQGMHEVAV